MGVIGAGMLLWGGVPHALGQKSTEMFIPLGQSPGLSGNLTVIGKIEMINVSGQSITVVVSSESWRGTVTNRTRIWLDIGYWIRVLSNRPTRLALLLI